MENNPEAQQAGQVPVTSPEASPANQAPSVAVTEAPQAEKKGWLDKLKGLLGGKKNDTAPQLPTNSPELATQEPAIDSGTNLTAEPEPPPTTQGGIDNAGNIQAPEPAVSPDLDADKLAKQVSDQMRIQGGSAIPVVPPKPVQPETGPVTPPTTPDLNPASPEPSANLQTTTAETNPASAPTTPSASPATGEQEKAA